MSKNVFCLIGFILAKFVLQYLLLSPEYDLQRDEYLHLDQANHLDWGYVSVPPVTAWIALISKWLGNAPLIIRFFPAFFGALTLLVVWKTVEALKGNLFACVLAATGVLFSGLLRLNQLLQPNSLDVLCWTSLYFVWIKYIQSNDKKWMYWFWVAVAIGFLNKYNIVFLLVGLLPAILLTPQRALLLNRQLYLVLLLGLLLILPNLIWQCVHGFPVFHHMKLLAQTQLIHVSRLHFLKQQLLFFMGSLLIIAAGLYSLLVYTPFKDYRAFGYAFVFTLATFILLRAKDYYAIGIYPVYIAFGAVYLTVNIQSTWGRAALLALPMLCFIPVYQVAFPNRSPQEIADHPERYKPWGLLRWEDGQDHPVPQDFADMLGWQELAAKVDTAYCHLADPAHTLVLCDNYGQAGAINYYTSQNINAVAFNADYLDWFDLTKTYRHLIRVKEAQAIGDELEETGALFRAGYIEDSIRSPYARERGTTVFVFQDAKVNITSRLAREIAEEHW
ncbi:ArnT family glycosyltransferase [Spirosoma pollinicola]|uniref:Glycosyl transferase n=1 Tax=Spirosoma pollinicola TaxID=2057025 RepID=A0A2K8ZA05_9BACT|nr:glycosyltransferase family 39 protein [Spirosoma pollinicola]AUD06694.1 glycosyl transferase [Spirosoma pollinicola]